MNRWLAALSALALIAAGAFAALRTAEPGEAQSVGALEFTVVTKDGLSVELHFAVRADDETAAYEAARAATETLFPDSVVPEDEPGMVRAAYAFWPWQWAAELLPVPVAYNPAGAPAGVAESAITGGIAPWNNIPTSAFGIDYIGLTDALPGLQESILDGQNVIGWLDLDCAQGCVLGVTTKVQSAYEVDIALNRNPAARLGDGIGGTADVQSVLLHELGHLAGLEHSCQPFVGSCSAGESESVMYPRYQGVHRGLEADDIAGISTLYPQAPEPIQEIPVDEVSVHEYEVELGAGWNLVVLPPGSLDVTMSTLACVDAVYTRQGNEWLIWLRHGSRALNSLTTARGDTAYWLSSSASCSQTFSLMRSH